jgi:hypothetical protein
MYIRPKVVRPFLGPCTSRSYVYRAALFHVGKRQQYQHKKRLHEIQHNIEGGSSGHYSKRGQLVMRNLGTRRTPPLTSVRTLPLLTMNLRHKFPCGRCGFSSDLQVCHRFGFSILNPDIVHTSIMVKILGLLEINNRIVEIGFRGKRF